MADKIEDGGLAFPGTRLEQVGTVADHGFTDDDSPTFDYVQHPGMSLRDWFAGQAFAAILSNPSRVGDFAKRSVAATEAYYWADDMLKARKGEL